MRIGNARTNVQHAATGKPAVMRLVYRFPFFIFPERTIYRHASRQRNDIIPFCKFLHYKPRILRTIGIIAAAYRCYNTGNSSKHKGGTHFSYLTVPYRSPTYSHPPFLFFQLRIRRFRYHIYNRDMLLTYLLTSTAADTDVEQVGKWFYVARSGTFICLANIKPVRTCKCAAPA